jgi:hypothetical protein
MFVWKIYACRHHFHVFVLLSLFALYMQPLHMLILKFPFTNLSDVYTTTCSLDAAY